MLADNECSSTFSPVHRCTCHIGSRYPIVWHVVDIFVIFWRGKNHKLIFWWDFNRPAEFSWRLQWAACTNIVSIFSEKNIDRIRQSYSAQWVRAIQTAINIHKFWLHISYMYFTKISRLNRQGLGICLLVCLNFCEATTSRNTLAYMRALTGSRNYGEQLTNFVSIFGEWISIETALTHYSGDRAGIIPRFFTFS